MEQLRKRGRPRVGGADPAVVPRCFRLSARDAARLAALAVALETTEAAIVRQSIRELAQRKGVVVAEVP